MGTASFQPPTATSGPGGASFSARPAAASIAPLLRPARALLHPAWWIAVGLLLVNDHWLKGAGLLPGLVTGKLSDVAGLFAAPMLLATLVRARSGWQLLACHAAAGLVFSAIKVSPACSDAFTSLLGLAGITWKNWCDPTDLAALPALFASLVVLGPRAAGGDARPRRLPLETLAILAGLPVMLASGDPGGANAQGRAPGSGDKGIDVAVGEIAVDPAGAYFVSKKDGTLSIGWIDARRVTPVSGLPSPSLLAFWPASMGRGFFVVSRSGAKETVTSYDVAQSRVVWTRALARPDTAIQVDEAGTRVVVWNGTSLAVLAADTGAVIGEVTPADGVVDVDVRDRIVVTERHVFDATGKLPTTRISVRALADTTETCAVTVPNCSSELVVPPGSSRAFLAPTTCQRDPVSVIDLDACKHEQNLPGFGPVALSQNGRTAVAFVDRDASDPNAPPLPADVKTSAARYHLMFIAVDTLAYGTTPIGDALPRYAVTPDGKLLLVDAWLSQDNIRIVDVDDRSIRTVSGPHVQLESYALLPDSSAGFALWSGSLFRIDLPLATSERLSLGFTPTSLNVTPKGELLLKEGAGVIHLYDAHAEREVGTFQ